MVKSILISLVIMALLGGAVGGTLAAFSDTETSTDNSATAGTLDLTVDNGNINVVNLTIPNAAPGDSGSADWTLENTGTINGTLTIAVVTSNNDNGIQEPEGVAGDDSDGDGNGELQAEGNTVWTLTRRVGDVDVVLVPDGTLAAVEDSLEDELVALAADGGAVTYTLDWSVPDGVGNMIQSDSLGLDITFTLAQA